MTKISIVSGYFDPLHIGHIEYLELAKKQGEYLVVIVNNDKQAKLKKGKSFMSEQDRCRIILSLGIVDEVILSCNTDKYIDDSIEKVVQFHNDAEFIFCNGGDRNIEESPETEICKKLGIKMIDGLGKKIRSSRDFTGLK